VGLKTRRSQAVFAKGSGVQLSRPLGENDFKSLDYLPKDDGQQQMRRELLNRLENGMQFEGWIRGLKFFKGAT
jgi:hypothetical protein